MVDTVQRSGFEIAVRDQATRPARRIARSLDDVNASAQRMAGGVSTMDRAVRSLGSGFAALRRAIVAVGGASTLRSIASAAISLEQVNARLSFVTGSSRDTRREFGFVNREVERLGLELETTADSYSRLAVATKGTAIEGQATRDIFLGLAEAATVLGLDSQELAGALQTIQQMAARGVVRGEALRDLFGGQLASSFASAADVFGMTNDVCGVSTYWTVRVHFG